MQLFEGFQNVLLLKKSMAMLKILCSSCLYVMEPFRIVIFPVIDKGRGGFLIKEEAL